MVLEVPMPHGANGLLLDEWRARALAMSAALDWPPPTCSTRPHATGTSLAMTAPIDRLLTATGVNEWALLAAAAELGIAHDLAALDEDSPPVHEAAAETWLRQREAGERGTIPVEVLSDIRPDVRIALVTGSNGKTTTTRLIAAMLRTQGHVVGYCCTDGVFVADECLAVGDYSGPEGARLVLSDARVTAAVLETARGGLLRRGLVVPRADVAVITNVAADHFGDYGVDTLEDLARVKSVVAQALGPEGVLVMNGADATLRALSLKVAGRIEWVDPGATDDLVPPWAEMPFTLGGAARHNVANARVAACAARALGVPLASIHLTLRRFGEENADNAGRLERFEVAGMRVWVDYAHNPHGLSALLAAAKAHVGTGRLGLLLGQAGDRDDAAIRALARTTWTVQPARIVLKDLDGYLRGRLPGEVPSLLRAELLACGASPAQLSVVSDETTGVLALLEWGVPGDLLVMPVHALDARRRAVELIRHWPDPSGR